MGVYARADGERGVHKEPADSDFKYVNVRRLLIFINGSIDRALPRAVFQPKAEPLLAVSGHDYRLS